MQLNPQRQPDGKAPSFSALLRRRFGSASDLSRGVGAALILQLSGASLMYLSRVFLARWMGAAEYGSFVYAIAWMTLISVICMLGTQRAVLRFLPELSSEGDWGRVAGVIRGMRRVALGVAISVAGITASVFLGLAAGDLWVASSALLTGVLIIPLLAQSELHAAIARAMSKIVLSQFPIRVLRPVLVIAFCFLWWTATGTLDGADAIRATVAALLVIVVTQRVWLRAVLPQEAIRARPVYEMRAWMRVSIALAAVVLFEAVLDHTDVIMLGSLVGNREAGIYHAAVRTVNLMGAPLLAVLTVATPQFASLRAKGDQSGLQALVFKLAHWSFWPGVLGVFVIGAFADTILGLFGQEFRAARSEFLLLMLGQLIHLGIAPALALMNVSGLHRESARVLGFGALINVSLNALLIPAFGIAGAAMASVATTLIWQLWLYRIVRVRLQLRTSIVDAVIANGPRNPKR